MGVPAPSSDPQKFFISQFFNFFCDLKPHAKFHNPTITPSWRKVSVEEERKKERKKEEREKNAVNSGHLVL